MQSIFSLVCYSDGCYGGCSYPREAAEAEMKNHPLHNLAQSPSRPPDWENHLFKYWFTEMVRAYRGTDGYWRLNKLAVCPLTGLLMYMDHSYPITWHLISSEMEYFGDPMYKAFNAFIIEKNLLGCES